MRNVTIQKLNKLNEKFYSQNAQSFHDTRAVHWPGWERIKKLQNLRVLDLACGNGRFLKYLIEDDFDVQKYLGIDSSVELIDLARKSTSKALRFMDFKFIVADLLNDNWEESTPDDFNLVVAFGLFHHIPGFENRIGLFKKMARKLEKNGRLVVSFWQFLNSPRLAKSVVPTAQITSDVPLNDLEEGDYFLNWQGDNSRLRYCHHFSDEEIERIKKELQNLGLKLTHEYKADGKEGNLNAYLIFTGAREA